MADKTKIEWTDATWNPVTGCSIVSPGCTNCYAMKLAGTRLKHHPSRIGLTRDSKAGPVWNGELRLNTEWLDQPLKWKQPRMIFTCAHGDLFAEGVPNGWIMQVLLTMGQAHQHVFQVLTKRPDRMRDFFRRWADTTGEDLGEFKEARGPEEVRKVHPSPRGQLFAAMLESMGTPPAGAAYPFFDWMGGMMFWPDVFPNIWLGTSIEDSKRAAERKSLLLETPAAMRWISAEPLLGDVTSGLGDLEHIDWVVAGGESGQDARPMHPEWARSLRDRCAETSVPFFFKQWGNWQVASESNGHLEHNMQDNDAWWIDIDGSHHKPSSVGLTRPYAMHRVPKAEAGRLLDGVEHNGFPRLPAQFRAGARA